MFTLDSSTLLINAIILISAIYWFICIYKIDNELLPQTTSKITNIVFFCSVILALILGVLVLVSSHLLINSMIYPSVDEYISTIEFILSFKSVLPYMYAIIFIFLFKRWSYYSSSKLIPVLISLIFVYLLFVNIFFEIDTYISSYYYLTLIRFVITLVIFLPLSILILVSTVFLKNHLNILVCEKQRDYTVVVRVLLILGLAIVVLRVSSYIWYFIHYQSVNNPYQSVLWQLIVFETLLDGMFCIFVAAILGTRLDKVFIFVVVLLFIVVNLFSNMSSILGLFGIHSLMHDYILESLKIATLIILEVFLLFSFDDFKIKMKTVILAVISSILIIVVTCYNKYYFEISSDGTLYYLGLNFRELMIVVIIVASYLINSRKKL